MTAQRAGDKLRAMKRLVIALNIMAAVPGVILVPLAPFAFLIVDGEGRAPGWFHEYAVMALLAAYPLVLALGIGGSVWALRRGRLDRRWPPLIAVLPALCALLLAWAFVDGGVRLR